MPSKNLVPPSRKDNRHGEAFCIMVYRCENGKHEERIWNSRDGVTPFVVDCLECGQQAQHADWGKDKYCPDFKPSDHPAVKRVFADITKPAAIQYAAKRMECFVGTQFELQGEKRLEMQVELANSFIGDVHCVPLSEVWVGPEDFSEAA